ncbi:hypothetical protein RvY_17894 [Ramazzottius varieornatus]|uniref:Hemerythrin-like domain-containing protein n=1 Tax=Ramazzottius varieornatus TaxID=947166 RepID=A0A1D1W3T9_RAMVA|nr:hypothetical protein RvY_17894 [Ramazzottius varieornatus]
MASKLLLRCATSLVVRSYPGVIRAASTGSASPKSHDKPSTKATPVNMSGNNIDVTERVIIDHNDIKQAYEKLKTMSDGKDAEKWFNQLLWTIARHSAAEELVVYPLLEKTGKTGQQLADKSREDHQKTKEALAAMDGQPMTPELRRKIDTMMADLLEHIAMEEGPGGDLEVLRKGVNKDDLLSEGKSFEKWKLLVPTHAHPNAPDKPPFATVAGFMAAKVDKLRDLFRSFPDQSEVKSNKEQGKQQK